MQEFTLSRLDDDGSKTCGTLTVGEVTFQTLERPWLNNKPYVSCIPAGDYVVHRDTTGRHQYYAVADVPNRTYIEIHVANVVEELQGCIALGLGFNEKYGTLVDSKKACDLFIELVGDTSFKLNIVDYTK